MIKMAKTIFRNIFHKPATKMYPVKPREYFKNTRGSIRIEINSCIFCGICQRKCPTNAINVVKDKKEWEISRMKCISCSACVEACPKKCLFMENKYTSPGTLKEKEMFIQNA